MAQNKKTLSKSAPTTPETAPVVEEVVAPTTTETTDVVKPVNNDVVVSERFDSLHQKVVDITNALKDLQSQLKTVQKELVKMVKSSSKRTKKVKKLGKKAQKHKKIWQINRANHYQHHNPTSTC